jgi:hypothetical protein
MKTLSEVAKVYKSIAQSYIQNGYSGWKKPPYDTGNLYRSIGSFNNDQRMAFKQGNRSFLNLNYAPPEAKYGIYVEKGTRLMASRPFAETAANSSEVRAAIKQYQNSEVDEVRKEIDKRMTIIMKEAGFKKK